MNNEKLRKLYRIAKFYYYDNLTQLEISQMENLSRAQISRLLTEAKEAGLIKFEINNPIEHLQKPFAFELAKKLGLKEVHLIPSQFDSRENNYVHEQYRNLAMGAVDCLIPIIKDAKTIGVGWGRTLYLISKYLTDIDLNSDAKVIPLMGVSGFKNPYLQINTIVDRFSEKLSIDRRYYNFPAIARKGETKSSLEEKSRQIMRQYWDELEVAIISIGSYPTVSKTMIYEFSLDYYKAIESSDTIGDILSQFFYKDGTLLKLWEQFDLFAYPIEKLKRLNKVVAIAAGQDKVDPIITAAQNKFFNILITDYDTAHLIYKQIND